MEEANNIKFLKALQESVHFYDLNPRQLGNLLEIMTVKHYPAETTLIKEGEATDFFAIIVDGEAEVSVQKHNSSELRAILTASDSIGLIESNVKQQPRIATATVISKTEMTLLLTSDQNLHGFLKNHPGITNSLKQHAQDIKIHNFIKSSTSLNSISNIQAKELAKRVRPLCVAAEQFIIKQGDMGAECFLIVSGKVAVIYTNEQQEERVLKELTKGDIFGETALIAQQPRNASVKAIENTELLELDSKDFLDVVETEKKLNHQMLDLLLKRSRPKQTTNIEIHHRITGDGDKVTILKDPSSHQYFQLDEHSYYIWQLLDGNHTLRDINLKLMRHFKIFCPPMTEHVVRGLVKNGFVTIDESKIKSLEKMPLGFKILFGMRSVMEARINFKHTDSMFSQLYHYFGKYYYAPLGQVLLFSILTVGFVAFWLNAESAITTLVQAKNPTFYMLFLIPANFIALAFHEMGHGLATKHVKRVVSGAGFGWYWITPIAFVNTTDMWLATRKERNFVNLAGVQNDAFIAGMAMLIGYLITNPVISACLWLFACLSYFNIFKNLNPFLEFDGYFVLMDIFDKPRLRQRATLWLVEVFPKNMRFSNTYREHIFAVYYWLCSIIFIITSIIMTRLLQIEVLHPIFPSVVPGEHSVFMSWFLPFIVVFMSFLTIYFEARHLRRHGQHTL